MSTATNFAWCLMGLIVCQMPEIVGIFIFITKEIFMLSYVYQENICNF